MRAAIFGDIGSDYHGLKEFFVHSGRQGIDQYVCLGDICHHNSRRVLQQTNDCIQLLQDHHVESVFGNHDKKVLDIEYPWLNLKSLDYLCALPLTLVLDEIPDVEFAHKSPSGRGLYFPRPSEFECLKNNTPPKRIGFFGHTHKKVHFAQLSGKIIADYVFSSWKHPKEYEERRVSKGTHLINPGTIDRSRLLWYFGECPSYVVYDSGHQRFSFRNIR